MSQDNLKRSLPRNFTFDGQNKAEVLRNFYTMMKQHGISPTVVHYLPKVTDSGNAAEGDWADKVAPFLDETDGAVGVQDNQLPFLRFFPWSRSEHPSSSAILNYLTQMTRVYKDRGWHKKAYVYILDETTKRSEELQAERYARLAHKASARSGYRIKFLLTDDPRPHSLGGVKTANTFLYDDVDIWTLRYYYFFGRIPAVRERQKAGKDIWWYSYVNDSVRKTPSFVIDKPHIDSRVWGWMMEKWDVDGILNWGFNRWGKPASGDGWRDPYRNPAVADQGEPAQQRRHLPRLPRLLPALRAGPADGGAGLVAAAGGAARRPRGARVPAHRQDAAGRRDQGDRRPQDDHHLGPQGPAGQRVRRSPCTRAATRPSTRRARRWRSSSRRSSRSEPRPGRAQGAGRRA